MIGYEIKNLGPKARSKLLAIPETKDSLLYVRLLFNSNLQQTFLIRADLLAQLGRLIIEENGYVLTDEDLTKNIHRIFEESGVSSNGNISS